MAADQETRQLKINTPLGPNKLLLTGFSGREEISRLFSYRLELVHELSAANPNEMLNHKDIVGKSVTFYVKRPGPTWRPFNGFVTRFSAGTRTTRFRQYRAEVVPWLWFLTRTSDCRIFQNQTVPQILTKIFTDLGFNSKVEMNLSGSHPEWEYCVQYRETDFNFISRLMEHEGMFYFFQHSDGDHKLYITDQKGGYQTATEREVEFEYSVGAQARLDVLKSWEHQYEYRSGKWAQTDYDFIEFPAKTAKQPYKLLLTEEPTTIQLENITKYEIYDYPGEYEKKTGTDGTDGRKVRPGTPLTKIRMEEEETPYDVVSGSSTCKTFTPGHKFTTKPTAATVDHSFKAEEGKTYLLTSVTHSATEPATYEGSGGGAQFDYSNSFTCIPEAVIYRPTRLTLKPVIQGSQTAVVTGPPGEEIYPDKYGRVLVQFYWDREGLRGEAKPDGTSQTTCYVRVSQPSAGKNWGSMYFPRIGQEVVVSFLEGNPDRPLITGVVYNADQMPAYDPTVHKTRTWIKTNTSPGGVGFNELRFEDKKDNEQIFIHAERNMDTRVKNDSLERIFGNRHQIIGWEKDGEKGGDQREMVYQDKHLNIKRNQIEHIEGNMELLIGKGEAEDGGNLDVSIEKNQTEHVGADKHLLIGGNQVEKIGGNLNLMVGPDGGNVDFHVTGVRLDYVKDMYGIRTDDVLYLSSEKEFHQTAGAGHLYMGKTYALETDNEIHLKSKTIIIEAATQISLKVGGNFIDISASGIAIQGTKVDINSGGAAGSGSGVSVGMPGDAAEAEPTEAKEAEPIEPTLADNSQTGHKSKPDSLS